MKRIRKYLLTLMMIVFGLFILSGCTSSDDYKLKISSPSGAPLVAIAGALDNDKQELSLNLEAQALQPLFVNNEMDFIVAPINLGATLYSKNANYKLAAVLTWGNLFFASKNADFDNVEDINGKELVLFGENTINDVVCSYVLNNFNVTPVTKTYLGSTQLTQQGLLSDDGGKVYLVAEPAISAAKFKDATIKTISVQDLFYTASSGKKFAQAGLFVNKNTLVNHEMLAKNFIKKVSESVALVKTEPDALADKAISFGISTPKAVLVSSFEGCNISFVKAKDAKTDVEYTANLDLTKFGGSVPNDEFYYE